MDIVSFLMAFYYIYITYIHDFFVSTSHQKPVVLATKALSLLLPLVREAMYLLVLSKRALVF
jgi:hypothetical protein